MKLVKILKIDYRAAQQAEMKFVEGEVNKALTDLQKAGCNIFEDGVKLTHADTGKVIYTILYENPNMK